MAGTQRRTGDETPPAGGKPKALSLPRGGFLDRAEEELYEIGFYGSSGEGASARAGREPSGSRPGAHPQAEAPWEGTASVLAGHKLTAVEAIGAGPE